MYIKIREESKMREEMFAGSISQFCKPSDFGAELAGSRERYQQLYEGYDKLNRDYRELYKRWQALDRENEALKQAQGKPGQAYAELRQENERLTEEGEYLRSENERLSSSYSRLRYDNEQLRDKNATLSDKNNRLWRVSAQLLCRLKVAGLLPEAEQETVDCESETKQAPTLDVLVAEVMNEYPMLRIEYAMDLQVKTYNCLKRSNINTLGDLCKYSALELLNGVRLLGVASLNGLNYNLGLLGLELADEKNVEDQAQADKILTPSRARLMTLQRLHLSERVYDEAKKAGFSTAEDVLYRSEEEIRRRFSCQDHADEFLKRVRALGFHPGSIKRRMTF